MSSRELKLGRQARDLQAEDIQIRDAGTETGAITFSLSSEAPVQRWYGTEILDHSAKAVRLDRLKAGAMPLLFNHDWNDPIGMIDAGRLKDGRLVVEAHFFDTDRAREVATMMRGGLHNVSIGYDVAVFEEDVKTQTYTATDWTPLEGSIVTVPADISVGMGRQNLEAAPIRVVPKTPPATGAAHRKETAMSEVATPAAGANADVQVIDNGAQERLRIKGLQQLSKDHKIDDETREQWIDHGTTVEDAARATLSIIAQRAKSAPVKATELGLSRRETERYSICRAINAVVGKNWDKAGFELEASRAIAQRLGRGNASEFTFFVPLEVQQREYQQRDLAAASSPLVATDNVGFIDLLRNRSVAFQMGATRLPGLQGNVAIPKMSAGATSYWLASESTAITEGTPTLTQVTLSPKNIGAYTEISRQLTLQSSPSAEGLVMSDLAKSVALAVDLAALAGDGTGGAPTGILATSGIGSVTGTTLGIAGILEFQTDTAVANALAMSSGYVTTPAVAGLLAQRQRFSSTDTPLWEGNILDGKVMGFRAMSSNQMPSAKMLFGDFSQVVIGEWGVLEVEVNPYANFQAGITGVRAFYTVDVAVRHAGAFSAAATIT